MARFLKRLFWLAVLAGIAWGALFLSSSAFAARWREFVIAELDQRGIHLDFSNLTVDPVRGLVARNVRVFNDAERKQLVAAVDRISLDFDLGKLLRKQVVIESLNLSQTKVALPIDPEHPDLAEVALEKLTARVFLMDDRLDVRRAEGEIGGVRLSVTGNVILPERENDPEKAKRAKERAMKRLAFIRENRQQIQSGLKWLERFQFAQKPLIAIEVNGDAEELQNLEAKLTLSAKGLGYGGYVCREVEARAEYSRGFVDLQELKLRDGLGSLEGSATWQTNGEEVSFRLTSSADIPGLASAFLSTDKLREAVFYEPPDLAVEGTWYVKGAKAAASFPLSVIGRLQCGRFTSRGEIFEGLAASFGVEPEGFYLREGLLRHKTGSLGFQTMFHEAHGLKYRATLKMDPHIFLPFFQRESTRELVNRFAFRENSGIFAMLEGAGPGQTFAGSKSRGRVELRDFAYRDVEFQSVTGELEIDGPRLTFKNVRGRRAEGEIEAKEVYVDDEHKWLRLTGVYSRLDPVAITSAFAKKTAQHITRYKLPGAGTEVAIAGIIGWRNPDLNDFHVSFRSVEGTGVYPLWGEEYVIARPAGELDFKKSNMLYDIKGQLFGRDMSAKGTVDLTPERTGYTVALRAGKFPYDVFGKELPFSDVIADVKGKGTDVSFDLKATVLGGKFAMDGVVDDRQKPSAYKGEIKLEAISFKQFASTYSPEYETDGDLTGHFNFTGRLDDDWKQLKGSGVLMIVNGNLYAIPVLGPLTPLLGKLLPKPIKGYNVAKEASCNFRVADGFAVTEDLEALTTTFRIVSKGSVDFIRDDIDFTAEARMRGLPGLVFLPVSRLLEYKGEGTIGDAKWKPRLFGLTGSDKEGDRRVPTEAELDAAARGAARDGEMPASGSDGAEPGSGGLKKPRLSPLGRPGK